jgi:hypothetical protein
MEYRCPLCLKELKAADKFVRYCTNFESKNCLPDVFDCTPTNLQTKIFCKKCPKDFRDAEGVFLLHKGCEVKNPFVVQGSASDTRRIETGLTEKSDRGIYTPPDKLGASPTYKVTSKNTAGFSKETDGDFAVLLGESVAENRQTSNYEPEQVIETEVESTANESIEFGHWILNFMRNLPTEDEIREKFPDSDQELSGSFPGDEMWFPLSLFRAITETDNNERRCAAIVELFGAKSVGKTIVAIQSMNYKGYKKPEFMFDGLAGNFILTQVNRAEVGTSQNSMMADLCLNYILLNSQPNVVLPEGTENSVGTLKVTFFKQTNKTTKTSLEETVEKKSILDDETKAVAKKGFAKFLSILYELFGKTVPATEVEKQFDKLKPQKPAQLTTAKNPFNYALIFYDVKGEHARFTNAELKNIKQGVEKVAIFVSAVEMMEGSGDSLSTANSQLLKLKSSNKSICLVITKIDSLPANNQLKECLENLADNNNSEQVRNKLLETLQLQIDSKGDGNIRQLRHYMTNPELPIFPVWTEGLSEDGKTSTVQPKSFGMDEFVNWCFGFDIVG